MYMTQFLAIIHVSTKCGRYMSYVLIILCYDLSCPLFYSLQDLHVSLTFSQMSTFIISLYKAHNIMTLCRVKFPTKCKKYAFCNSFITLTDMTFKCLILHIEKQSFYLILGPSLCIQQGLGNDLCWKRQP